MRPLPIRPLLALAVLLAGAPVGHAAGLPHVVVFFQSWSANLDDAATHAIQTAADWAKQHPQDTVTVLGFASPVGSNAANQDLSRLRAQIVSDTLVADGVPVERIQRRALGPLPDANDEQEARRVEIALGAE